jgi:argininosuccinate lyase
MKLWQNEGRKVSEKVLDFTIGNDRDFDLLLAKYDVQGSLAHAEMLKEVGLLNDKEYKLLDAELKNILVEIEEGVFKIDEACEDVHSQIEAMLTQRVGDAGKRIHTGRSRNDQVAVDIKLYLRDELKSIKGLVNALFRQLLDLSDKHGDKLIPGYTHLQVAMPSSFGLWFGAYAESLLNDMELLHAAYRVVNKNPLGSGAGYGSSFPLNRSTTTKLLKFSALDHNSIYAQMSRAKAERFTAYALSALASTLSKLSMDVCLFMNQNFGFLSFPERFTTGSSIMPHKRNPDVFELIRAKCNRVQSVPNELTLLSNNLPSGYHRDFQLTKEVLFPAIESLKSCLDICGTTLAEVKISENILQDTRYHYSLSVHCRESE